MAKSIINETEMLFSSILQEKQIIHEGRSQIGYPQAVHGKSAT